MAKNNFDEINFQHYVDAVKQKRIDWNMFIDFIQDLSYSDRNRLRILNAILLTELTVNFSDLDKFKYLNVILLREFKNHIQKEHTTLEMIQMEELEKSVEEPEIDQLLQEIIDEEREITFVNEIEDDLNQDIKNHIQKENTTLEIIQMEELEKSVKGPEIDELLNEETTDEEMEIAFANEIEDDLNQDMDYKCKFCGKPFSQKEAMKKHINKSHKGKKVYKCKSCGKSLARGSLKKHIHTVHGGHKDYKCESCSKSFSQVSGLKRHIQTIHETQKDYKCESCGKLFSQAINLNLHKKINHNWCRYCDEEFDSKLEVTEHIEIIHGVKQ